MLRAAPANMALVLLEPPPWKLAPASYQQQVHSLLPLASGSLACPQPPASVAAPVQFQLTKGLQGQCVVEAEIQEMTGPKSQEVPQVLHCFSEAEGLVEAVGWEQPHGIIRTKRSLHIVLDTKHLGSLLRSFLSWGTPCPLLSPGAAAMYQGDLHPNTDSDSHRASLVASHLICRRQQSVSSSSSPFYG